VTLKSYQVKKLQAELAKKLIEIEEKTCGIQHHQKQAEQRIREISIWSDIKKELDDGSFDKDDKDTNQLLSLARRYCVEAFNSINMSRGGGGDISSFNNITAQFRMLVGEVISRGLVNELLVTFGGPGNQIFDFVCVQFGLQVQQTPPVQPTWAAQPQS
jgi:hypothetical protein